MRSVRLVLTMAVVFGSFGVASVPATAAVVAGPDFDGDGFADLAIGVPGESVNAAPEAGAVHVLHGGAGGLTATGSTFLTQATPGIPGVPEHQDFFGQSLAWGDVDDDGYDDLVIGAPGESFGLAARTGAVFVVFGSASGLDPGSARLLLQGRGPVPGALEHEDGFGYSLAVGDLDGDGHADIAIGTPFEDVGAKVDAGAVFTVHGADGGALTRGALLTQSTPGVPGGVEPGDWFGWSVAIGDLGDPVADAGDPQDLAIGATREDLGSVVDAGIVTVLFGADDGATGSGSRLFSQGSPGVPGVPEFDDRFGHALAIGPLVQGGPDDLAVGVAGETVVQYEAEGFVVVLPAHDAAGPSGVGALAYRQGAGGVAGEPFEFDSFGAELAVADVRGDAHHELVVGVPYDSIAPVMYAGSAHVLTGTADGPTGAGSAWLHQGLARVPGALEIADSFGFALWAGDYDGDGNVDLAIGAPTEGHSGAIGAGAVVALEHDGVGVPDGARSLWTQETPGVPGNAEQHDRFGWR